MAGGQYRFLGAFLAKAITSNKTAQYKLSPQNDGNEFPRLGTDRPKFSILSKDERKYYVWWVERLHIKDLKMERQFRWIWKENGSEIEVTDDNKYEFMGLRFKAVITRPSWSFVNGFRDLILFRKMPIDILNLDEFRFFITGRLRLTLQIGRRIQSTVVDIVNGQDKLSGSGKLSIRWMTKTPSVTAVVHGKFFCPCGRLCSDGLQVWNHQNLLGSPSRWIVFSALSHLFQ